MYMYIRMLEGNYYVHCSFKSVTMAFIGELVDTWILRAYCISGMVFHKVSQCRYSGPSESGMEKCDFITSFFLSQTTYSSTGRS